MSTKFGCKENIVLERPRRIWKDNINMDLREIGFEGVRVWTGFTWLRIGTGGGSCEHGDEPSGSRKCGEFLY
jgi:hypothetical protein